MVSPFRALAESMVRPTLFGTFAEQVAAEPTSTPRLIDALVERNPPVIYDEAGAAYMNDWVVRFADDATLGIAAGSIIRGQTQLSIQREQSGVGGYVLKTIVQIELRANGFVQVRVR